MDPDKLIDSLGDHLDGLNSYVTSALIIALITYWSALMRMRHVEILGLKIQREYASFVVGAAFILLNAAILISFLRIKEFLALIPDADFEEALTKIASHPWLLNPFAFAGSGLCARSITCWGLGILTVVWWICNTSYALLQETGDSRQKNTHQAIVRAVGLFFLVVGILSMNAIFSVYQIILEKGRSALEIELYESIRSTSVERSVATFIGIAAGAIFFVGSFTFKNVLTKKQRGKEEHPDLPPPPPVSIGAAEYRMSNLPFHLSGWNGDYYRTERSRNGKPVWARPEHWYKGFLPLRIVGVTIWFDGQSWVLQRDCDPENVFMFQSSGTAETPAGPWGESGVLKKLQ